jgi:hypothetical protein
LRVDAAVAAEEMYFRSRLKFYNLLTHSDSRIDMTACSSAGKEKTSIAHYFRSP